MIATSEPNTTSVVTEELTAVPGLGHFTTHAEGYHVRCSRCGATSIAETARDTMRMCCPACERRLTLPAQVDVTCNHCQTANSFAHHLAGHSAACSACGRPLSIPALVGQARSRQRRQAPHHQSKRGHGQRTAAFADGAERSLFILAAAIGTLIFLVASSLY